MTCIIYCLIIPYPKERDYILSYDITAIPIDTDINVDKIGEMYPTARYLFLGVSFAWVLIEFSGLP